MIQRYQYGSFGNIQKIYNGIGTDISSTPIMSSHYAFTGREYDTETGLYYYRARYYDPMNGRFISSDKDPGVLDLPQTYLSSYAYVANSPFDRIDPSGNSFLGKLGAFAIGSIFGPAGQLIAINFSGEFSSGEKKFANTVAIMVLASVSGGAAGGLVGGGWAGAGLGGLAGGIVGGVGYEVAGVGNFREGFIAGAIAGAMAGARNLESTKTIAEVGNSKVTNFAFNQACGALAVGVLLYFTLKIFAPHVLDNIMAPFNKVQQNQNGNPNATPVNQPGQPAQNQSLPPSSNGSENACVA